jgi:DNA-binding MurR/RpiR family transcriptional regulator
MSDRESDRVAVGSQTVADRVEAAFVTLTRAERQAADALIRNYPVSGLGSITSLAQAAEVSTPTIARLVQKIGFRGYPDFQAALRDEVKEQLSNPLLKHERWAGEDPDAHILNRFAEVATDNVRRTLGRVDPALFDSACDLLADGERAVWSVGGRITQPLADYFCTHLSMVRDRVVRLPRSADGWPQALISMAAGDALVLFDIRRYQKDLQKLAHLARSRGVEVVLFTDKWKSPVSRFAGHRFDCRVEVPSAWDSAAAIMVLLETLIAGVQMRTWPSTSRRIKELEQIYGPLQLFL